MAVLVCIPTNSVRGFLFSPHPLQHLNDDLHSGFKTQSLPPLNYPEPAYFCGVLCVCGAWVGSGGPTGHRKCCPSGLYVRRAWGKPELLQATDGPPVSVSPPLRIENRQGIRACWMNERVHEILTLSLCAGIKCWPHLLHLWSRDVTMWFSSISRNFWESRKN